MKSELSIQLHALCISYHQMRLAESQVDIYDDNCENDKEKRDFLIQCLRHSEKIFNDQLKLVETLIDNQK